MEVYNNLFSFTKKKKELEVLAASIHSLLRFFWELSILYSHSETQTGNSSWDSASVMLYQWVGSGERLILLKFWREKRNDQYASNYMCQWAVTEAKGLDFAFLLNSVGKLGQNGCITRSFAQGM